MSRDLWKGYSLAEVMIALGVVAISVPLVLEMVIAGGESSQNSERETRSVLTSQLVFDELFRAKRGLGDFVESEDLPWGLGETEEWLIFELDNEGWLLGVADEMSYEGAWQGEDSRVRGLAAVRGYAVEDRLQLAGEPLETLQVEVRVEFPARAEVVNRRKNVFIKGGCWR